MRSNIEDKQVDVFVKLFKQGYSKIEIARKTNFSTSTVGKYLNQRGCYFRQPATLKGTSMESIGGYILIDDMTFKNYGVKEGDKVRITRTAKVDNDNEKVKVKIKTGTVTGIEKFFITVQFSNYKESVLKSDIEIGRAKISQA